MSEKNEPTGVSMSSTKGNAKSCSGINNPVEAGDQPAGKQPCRKRPGILVETKVDVESAMCLCSKGSQQYPGKVITGGVK